MFQGIFIFKVSRIENQILEKNWERGIEKIFNGRHMLIGSRVGYVCKWGRG